MKSWLICSVYTVWRAHKTLGTVFRSSDFLIPCLNMEDIYRSRRVILFDGFGAEVWEKGNTRDADFGKSSVAIIHWRHFLNGRFLLLLISGAHTREFRTKAKTERSFLFGKEQGFLHGEEPPHDPKRGLKEWGDKKGTIKSAPLFSDQCRATKALFSLPLPLFIRNFPSDELWEWEWGCARSFRKHRQQFFIFLTCWLRVFLPTALLWVVSRTKQFRFLLLYFENIVESNAI